MNDVETSLVLIRHGESVSQVEGFLSGHDTCGGLSERGREQAGLLRDRLLRTRELDPVDVVYTSILQRTIDTAGLLAPAFGELEQQRECDWCEIHPGEAEGLTWAEFDERYPGYQERRDAFTRRSPGAETWAEFSVRAGARLRRVADEHPGQRVVVVCHGGVIGASFIALGDLPMQQVIPLAYEIVNTSLTEWRWTGKRWQLVRFNDAAHLAGL
jgi:broad specificity phosphatase PhoE